MRKRIILPIIFIFLTSNSFSCYSADIENMKSDINYIKESIESIDCNGRTDTSLKSRCWKTHV